MFRLTLLVAALFFACPGFVRAQGNALNPPWLNGESRPEDLAVSLVTIGPGDAVYERFGHVALEVRDKRLQMAAFYNFGTFSFNGAFLLRVLGGRLPFRLGVDSAYREYKAYAAQDRDLRLLELELSPAQAARVAHELAVNAQPAHRGYLYHHFLDNCATRIVSVLDEITQGAFKRAHQGPGRLTFREHTRRFTARTPRFDFLVVLVNDGATDRPITRFEELFLPDELERAVRDFRYRASGEERSLVRREHVIHKAQRRRLVFDVPPRGEWGTLLSGVGCGAVLAISGQLAARERSSLWRRIYGALTSLYGFLFGLLGAALTSFVMFTAAAEAHFNQNVFLVNPLALVLLVLGLARASGAGWSARALFATWSALLGLQGVGLALKLGSGSYQDNMLVWAFVTPLVLGGWLGAYPRKVAPRLPAP